MAQTANNHAKGDTAAHSSIADYGHVVLVLQGGGALGAYQFGVYEALHDAGIEPAWVIGTSIGAINGAIIGGNPPEKRLAQLTRFWDLMQSNRHGDVGSVWPTIANIFANSNTYVRGIDGFFTPNPRAAWGMHTPLGAEQASFYLTGSLRETLMELTDFDYVNAKHGRLTLGAVNVRSGEMHYFDNHKEPLSIAHVMASGALPPAFPAVRIDGESYWDGGLYSNTPIEAVLDDKPRRQSVIFTANVWQQAGPEPDTIWQVFGRQKDIQFASRAKSHIKHQQQIHKMRHVIQNLAKHIPAEKRDEPEVRRLLEHGCETVMHVVPLLAPRIDGEDHTKDIDFTVAGIKARRTAGYADTRRALKAAPWRQEVDKTHGLVIHDIHHV
jgi:NTE family protein